MRQACNHPGLVLKNATDLDELELETDKPDAAPTPTSKDDDDLSNMFGSMKLAPAAERVGAACAICSKAIGKSRTAAGESTCSTCAVDMAEFAGMRSSTKVRRTLEILEGVRRESREASQPSGGESEGEDEGERVVKQGKGKGREVPHGPKKTIIFSQVRLSLFSLSCLPELEPDSLEPRSQFTSMFDLLEPFLKKAGHVSVRCKLPLLARLSPRCRLFTRLGSSQALCCLQTRAS